MVRNSKKKFASEPLASGQCTTWKAPIRKDHKLISESQHFFILASINEIPLIGEVIVAPICDLQNCGRARGLKKSKTPYV